MEFTYDPSSQTSVETRNGQPLNAGEPGGDEMSLQQRADIDASRSLQNTSQYLAQRHHRLGEVGVAEDEYASHDRALAESNLADLQQRIYLETDPTKSQVLQRQAELLASQLVGGSGNLPNPIDPELPDVGEEDYATARANEDPALIEKLNVAGQWVNEGLIEHESAVAMNEVLSSNNPKKVQNAADLIGQLEPAMIGSGQNSGQLDEGTVSWFRENGGEESAKDIQTLTRAVASGAVSKADAIRTVMSNAKFSRLCLKAAQNPSINFQLNL